jgi:hypothetical protein
VSCASQFYKSPDITRLRSIPADSSARCRDTDPQTIETASNPPDLRAKSNDPLIGCLTNVRIRCSPKIGSASGEIAQISAQRAPESQAFAQRTCRIERNRALSGHIEKTGRKNMSRPHPAQQMNFPISITLYQQLLGAAQDTGFKKEYWEIGAEALADWLRRHKPDAIAMAKMAGYQWKQVFLPNGTLLRTVFNGKNHHCMVEDDHILHEGRAVSPSGFVNAVGGIRRNAWKSLWILLPDDTSWQLADSLRPPRSTYRARARKPSIPVREATTPASNVHGAPQRLADANTCEPTRFVDENRSESRQPPHPMRAHDLAAPAQVQAHAPAPTPTHGEHLRRIGQRPNRLDEIGSAAAADPLRAARPSSGDRRAGGTERRLGDNEALKALLLEAFLAFSRSQIPIQP